MKPYFLLFILALVACSDRAIPDDSIGISCKASICPDELICFHNPLTEGYGPRLFCSHACDESILCPGDSECALGLCVPKRFLVYPQPPYDE